MNYFKYVFIGFLLLFVGIGHSASFFNFNELIEKENKTSEDMFKLGVMYYEGIGVLQDYEETFYWFERSALQGYTVAQYSLGLVYAKGEGVEKNYVQSYKWLTLAQDQREGNVDDSILSLMDVLQDQMTPVQIEEAKELVDQFYIQ